MSPIQDAGCYAILTKGMGEVFLRLSCTEESGQREVVESHLRRPGWSLERTVDGPKREMIHQPEHLPWDSHSVDISIHQGRTHFDFRLLPKISAYPTNTANIELSGVLDDVPS